jgi:hypothetical protein
MSPKDIERVDNLRQAKTIKEFIDLSIGIYTPISLQTGDVYTGPLSKDHEREGYGLMIFVDESYFLGEWANDMANGEGKHVAVEGTVSEGTWLDN